VETPQTIEAVGTTIEDAISRGLDALNVQRNEVEIQVLESGSREARVRLTIKARRVETRAVEEQPAAPSARPSAEVDDGDVAASGDVAAAQRVLATLLARMHIRAEVEARHAKIADAQDQQEGPTILLDIRGNDLAALIGRRGETLDNLQYLTRLLAAKEVGHYLNLVLDVEGYKSHREQMLQQLAQRMAERVVTSHKPAALEPMPANERRIIHITLRDHPGVRTESVGTGENRKVTIVPKSLKR
jgi:spoIIIJ-associated protein